MKTFEDGKQISFTKYNGKKIYRSGAVPPSKIQSYQKIQYTVGDN